MMETEETTPDPSEATATTPPPPPSEAQQEKSSTPAVTTPLEELPPNRFSLELEFLQALASPAYLHFLATSKSETGDCLLLQEPEFMDFLKYLQTTWTQPAYARFIFYPHCLYFLELLIDKPSAVKEWTIPEFRNFVHQQQFLTWCVCGQVLVLDVRRDSSSIGSHFASVSSFFLSVVVNFCYWLWMQATSTRAIVRKRHQ